MKKIFAVVLHFKGKQFTKQCLFSLEKIKTSEFIFQTVVIDNHSPESIDDLKKKFPAVTFLKNKKNLGFAEGNNVGIRYALKKGADYVLVLNNDTTTDKDFLFELVKVAEGKNVGIAAPKIYFAPGYEYHKTRYKPNEQGRVFWYAGGKIDWQNVLASHRGVDEVNKGQYEKIVETDFASGCAMLIKREVLERVGLFDERYFLYLEDLEFCQRVKKDGYKIIYAPKAKIYHFNAGSSGVGSLLQDYFITRNRLLFGMRYAGLRARLNLLREGVKLLIVGRPWQKIAVRDYFLKKFGPGSWHD